LYAVVDLDYAATQKIAAYPPVVLAGLTGGSSDRPHDLIADGDALAISVFEPGQQSLFGRASPQATGSVPETFPKLIVDRTGGVEIPFAGVVHVAGYTSDEAAEVIRRALRGRAVDPQVTVTLIDSRANSVIVLGEVRASGHILLTPHNDRLLDVIATAGGPTRPLPDLEVQVLRGDRSVEANMASILTNPQENIRLAPQDQIRVLYQPRKYSTFGALGRISQVPIEDNRLTLAAAISRAGGLDTTSANPSAIYLFRFERPRVAAALGVTLQATSKGVPIVYRLNLRDPNSFFVAENFYVDPEDLLYVGRSDVTEVEKFLTVVNTATQVVYNIRVSTAVVNP
jgi:polysaccharide export outer membrane protein